MTLGKKKENRRIEDFYITREKKVVLLTKSFVFTEREEKAPEKLP